MYVEYHHVPPSCALGGSLMSHPCLQLGAMFSIANRNAEGKGPSRPRAPSPSPGGPFADGGEDICIDHKQGPWPLRITRSGPKTARLVPCTRSAMPEAENCTRLGLPATLY